MLSPRSRGKGGRRFPGRDGGRRKQKAVEWRKQAKHSVDELSTFTEESVAMNYFCPSGQSPAEAIYRFDQEIARTGIRYYAELHGSRFWHFFTLHVPAHSATTVESILARVQKQ